ncbi:hypothetical protein GVX81_10130 [[Haemophilus] felis]|nr:hypothetical protein [[Haemophilus] felis]
MEKRSASYTIVAQLWEMASAYHIKSKVTNSKLTQGNKKRAYDYARYPHYT